MQPIKLSILFAGILALTACGGGSSGKGTGPDIPPPLSSSSSSSSVDSSSSSSSSSSESSSVDSSSSSSSSSSESSSSVSSDSLSLKAVADFPIGVAVNAGNENNSLLGENANGAAQRAIVEQHFDQITAGNIMKMNYLHPQRDNFTFTQADALVDYAADNGISVHGHALVWHSDYQVPNWMKNFVGDQAAWTAIMKEHVQTIAAHYSGKVASWDVVNEAFEDNGSYRNSLFFQKMGASYLEEAFKNAREADPVADLYYNDYSLSPGGAKLQAVITMIEDFQARNIPIDGVGFQMHIYMDWPSINTIKNSFKAVVDKGLKVKVTELDIPINNPWDGSYSFPDNYQSEFTPALAQAQKVRYCEIMKAYIDTVPAAQRGGFTVWGISDSDTWLNSVLFNNNHQDWPLLFDNTMQAKPALHGVANGITGQPCP